MSGIREKSEGCLIAICVHLSMGVVVRDDQAAWIDILKDVLPGCDECSEPVLRLRLAATDLVQSRSPAERRSALSRLHYEVSAYFTMAAAQRHRAWREAVGTRT